VVVTLLECGIGRSSYPDMELQKKIKLHNDLRIDDNIKWSDQFKGSMSPQDIKTIDAQLNDLRNGWE
jgi:hypothetical protein